MKNVLKIIGNLILDLSRTIGLFAGGVMAFYYNNEGFMNVITVWAWLLLTAVILNIILKVEFDDYRSDWVINLDLFTWFVIGTVFVYNGWFATGIAAIVYLSLTTAQREVII